MKNILIALMLVSLAFCSCKKCGTCVYNVTYSCSETWYNDSIPKDNTYTSEECGKELKEVDGTTTTDSYQLPTKYKGTPIKYVSSTGDTLWYVTVVKSTKVSCH